MSELYHIRPSELLGIDCTYTAYCFDEACHYFIALREKYKKKRKPVFEEDKPELRATSSDRLQALAQLSSNRKGG